MVLPERKYTLDAGDVGKIHSISVIIHVLVVDFLTQNEESILGSNGIPKCKKLAMM